MILSNIAPARVWGGKGRENYPRVQPELIFKAMGVEPDIMFAGQLESKSAGQETPELFNVVYFLFTLSFVYISRLLSRCSSFGSYKSYSKPLYSCFRSNISQHFETTKVIIHLHCTGHMKVIFYFTQVYQHMQTFM